jgi:hypothetical protein
MKKELIAPYHDLDVYKLAMKGAPFHRFTGSPFRLKPHSAVGWP